MTERNTFIRFDDDLPDSISYLFGMLEDARCTTLERLEGITQEELDWQYAEGWNSIGALLHHFIANDHFFRILFANGDSLTHEETAKWEPGQLMGEHLPKLRGVPLEKLLADLETSRRELVASIEPISREEFLKHREGYNPDTGFNLAWAFYHLAEDEVHHRGQISILRKLYAARA